MPGKLKSVSFSSPYDSEQAEIDRRRRMAELLQAQGAQGIGGTEMIGGWAIPKSPLEGLGKAAQQVAGAYQGKQADEMAKALRERAQGDRSADMQAMVQALTGRPAQAAIAPGLDEMGGGPGAPAQAAQAPGRIDPSMIGQLRTPMAQQQALQMIMSQGQRDEERVYRTEDRRDTQAWRAEQSKLQREQRTADLQARLADSRLTAQDRMALQRELAEMQIAGRRELAGIAAGMRQPPQEPRPIAIMGPDNKPILVAPKDAIGKQPASSGRSGAAPLSATAQKELFEADDVSNSAKNAIDILKSIVTPDTKTGKSQNDLAYEGGTSELRRIGMSFVPINSESENATVDLKNKVTGQALENLKAIFGGMPTEGERKVLMELQGSVNQKATQRKDIFNRAIKLAERRMSLAQDKAKRLREGTYFGAGVATNQDGGSVLDQADAILRGMSGNR